MTEEQLSDRLSDRVKSITSDMKRYVEKRVELLLLNVGEQMSDWFAMLIQRITGILLVLGGTVFLLVALAIWLGDLLENQSLGYVLVSVPLLALGVGILFFQPRLLLKYIQNQFETELLRALYDRPREKPDSLPAKRPPEPEG